MMMHRTLGVCAAAVCLFAQPAVAATVFQTSLSGANERPTVATAATGNATVTINGTLLTVSANFFNLSSGLADGHIHCCVGPDASTSVALGFTGLPLGATSGTITGTYDLTLASTFRAAFITASGGTVDGARQRFLDGLNGGQTYFNLHSTNFPSGEVRGQLIATVPEPATWTMMIAGFGMLGFSLRSRRKQAGCAVYS
jgi:hypothetical protein